MVASDVWPPPEVAPYVGKWAEHAAWWAADTTALDAHHAAGPLATPEQSRRNGGRFWSRQSTAPLNPARNLLHVPLAADIAQTSADLLFGDKPTLAFEKEQGKNRDRLDGLLHEAALLNDLHFAAETCAAIGGVYLRPMWDTSVADRPLLTVVGADQAIPEIRYGVLVAVTFWEQLASPEGVVFRHLERHEPGLIRHTLHAGTETTLGAPVPYTEHPDMAWLLGVDLVDGNGINTSAITKRLLVDYIPNAPSRVHRKAGIGRADIDGSEGLLDALDETWTSWMRDLRLGRARIVVNEQALNPVSIGGPTHGFARGFDNDQEVYSPIPGQTSMGDGDFIKPVQFAIRVAEHNDTALALVERIVTSSGYSPESFGIHAEGALSGTAYKLRERRTFRTESRKQRLWGPAVEHTAEMLLAIGREVCGWETEARPSISWPETDTDEPLQRAQTIALLKSAEAISTETSIRMAQPQLDDEGVKAELARVLGEAPVDDGNTPPIGA